MLSRAVLILSLSVGLLTASAVASADLTTAFAAEPVVELASTDGFARRAHVRWYEQSQTRLEYENPTFYVLSGSGIGDVLNRQLTSGATEPGFVALTRIALDEDTGEALVAAGTPTPESLARLAESVPNFPRDALTAETASEASPLGPEPLWGYRHGFFATFWMDPLGLTVSDAIDEGKWEYNGTLVRNKWGDDDTYWFTPNGWTQVSHSWGTYYNAARTWMTVWTDAHHRTSSWFPSPTCGTTHIYYDANNFYGGGNGTRSGGVNTWSTGTCAGLLTYEAMVLQGT